MNFTGASFLLFFLPVTVLIYKCLPDKVRNIFLTLASLVFCALTGVASAVSLVVSVGVNFFFGTVIARGGRMRRVWLAAAVCVNVAALAVFKYAAILPLGISYYTFQAISYCTEVYKGQSPCGIGSFSVYMTMFPKLMQGPIVKYGRLCGCTDTLPLAAGIRRFVCGLAKKVLIANQMYALYEKLWAGIASDGAVNAWVCLAAYALFIYFDFSGYTDMAIGIGKMLGFELPENFRYPYAAVSITDFWRRWHITLSLWLRDYVYIPLGGNRKGRARQILNLLIVWTLTGLWHGAAWNFLLWGIYYFVLLVFEKFVLRGRLERIPALNHIYALFFVTLGWVLFSTDISDIGTFLFALFGGGAIGADAFSTVLAYLPTFVIAVFGCTPLAKRLHTRLLESRLRPLELALGVLVFCLCIAAVVSGGYSPFLYAGF